jgi:multidrug efflux pump subunit AcrA (membrane-fusion protein)
MKPKHLLLIVLLATAGGGAYWYQTTRTVESSSQIRVSGNIEATITEVSFKIAGRVVKRPVDEGYMVKQGDLTALLDDSDLVCEVSMRTADLQTAQAALAELEAGSRVEDIADRGGHAQGGIYTGRFGGRVASAGNSVRRGVDERGSGPKGTDTIGIRPGKTAL